MPTPKPLADLLTAAIDPTGTELNLGLPDLVALMQGLGAGRLHAQHLHDALQQPHEIWVRTDPDGQCHRTLLRYLDLSVTSPRQPYGLAWLRFGWRAGRWELAHLDLLIGSETSVHASVADQGLRRGRCVYTAQA